MNLNFKEALAALSRALPLVMLRAGVYVTGGFMVIVLFAMLLVASRLAGGSASAVIIAITVLAFGGGWVSGRALERFFLYRQRAAMLLAFSGGSRAAGGMAATSEESKRLIPDYPRWKLLNRALHSALYAFIRGVGAEFQVPPVVQGAGGVARILDLLAVGSLGQAVMALAYARGGVYGDRSVREGLALYFAHGAESRRLARKWLAFSACAQLFLFFCLAVPNWIFFRGAGAPVWIAVVLAAAIARLLHQAFIAPIALAGVSAALLAETRDRIPDPELCEKLAVLFQDADPAGAR
jgi:hypothetical protein